MIAASFPSTLTAKQVRAAQRVLDALDRCDERLNEHYDRQRRQPRKGFRGLVTLLIPGDTPGSEPLRLQAIARNVSGGGLSFIHPGPLSQEKILVGLTFDPANAVWFHADIVRAREMQDDFWEFGVAFRERAAM